MHCSLCGTENALDQRFCTLCDAPLHAKNSADPELSVTEIDPSQDLHLEDEDLTAMQPQWHKLALAVLFFVVLLLPWWTMQDLFEVPSDVREARQGFVELVLRFEADRDTWITKKDQVSGSMQAHLWDNRVGKDALHFEDLPLEVVYAYLVDDLGLTEDTAASFALYPSHDPSEPSLLLSKVDSSLWPFQIVCSLELELVQDEGALRPRFVAFRRGSRLEPVEAAWSYFGPELNKLRGLARFAGGIRRLSLYEQQSEGTAQAHVSWTYQHHAFRNVR